MQSACLPGIKVLEDPKFQLISATVDRITFIGTAELMLGRDVLLDSLVNNVRTTSIIVGIVLERQIHALQDIWWKQEIQDVVTALFCSSESYYTSHPIRRARYALFPS